MAAPNKIMFGVLLGLLCSLTACVQLKFAMFKSHFEYFKRRMYDARCTNCSI